MNKSQPDNTVHANDAQVSEDVAEMTPEEFREYMLNWMEEHTND